MLGSYRSVLGAPGAARLLGSALLARLPQGMSGLAILLLVRDSTHSYAVAGAAVGGSALMSALAAPVVGRLIDRFGRLRILPPAALGQSVFIFLLVLSARAGAGGAVLVGLSALAGGLLPPIAPTVRAILREVFDDRATRESAYALESVLQELIWVSGPLLVAIVISVSSPSGALLAQACVCVAGTLWFVRSPLARDAGHSGRREPRVSALSSPRLRALLAPMTLMGTGLGAIEVGLPSLALHAGSRSASGVMLALWSVGSMTGGLWYGSRVWSQSLEGRYRVLLIVAIVLTAPLIVAGSIESIAAGMVFSLFAGLTIAPVFSCLYALVGRAARPGSETEAFTWVTAALVGGIAAGSALGGLAITTGGVAAPFVLSCLASAMAALMATGLRAPAEQPA